MTIDPTAIPTYCNPLPLPNYPRGNHARAQDKNGGWDDHWQHATRRYDFRETADPSVLYHEGKWYLYPSCGYAWVSEDFVTWQHHPLPQILWYAPTIVKHGDRFLVTACDSPVFSGPTPLGPFEQVGAMLDHQGNEIKPWADPMLFADDDGQLYAYWGIGGPGIWGARVDPNQPNRLLAKAEIMFAYDPVHVWERFGEFNEDVSQSYVEGPWMFKHRGTYYLTYAGPGTEFRTYGMGCYVGTSPLGPFTYQKRNPILADSHGLVHGPGHGSLVRGPNDTIWAFYTCLVRIQHAFERRIGMDPAGFDDQGNLFVNGASEIPQRQPGSVKSPERGNDAGLLPVTVDKRVRASSEAPGRWAAYAIDNHMRTWWEAAADDTQPWIEIMLRARFSVSALRLIWCEPGLDYDNGIVPGPYRYKLEVAADWHGDSNWKTVIDRTHSDEDLLIDYRVFTPIDAVRARLIITGTPKGLPAALIGLTVFGVAKPY